MNQKRMEVTEQQRLFTEWMGDHRAILHHVVNGFAAGADRDDLRQEVMLAVWKSIPAFRGQAKPSTYLYRVCHNAALMWTRVEKNHRLRAGKIHADPNTVSNFEPEASTDERLNQLYVAIHHLKPLDRSLMLMFLDGLAYREIAEIIGITENNVGTKISRIKTALTQTLKRNQYEST